MRAIRRLHATHVILIGAVDNETIQRQLPEGTRITGYQGANRYQTALKVAQALRAAGGNTATVFFSSGNNANLTDALTIDPVAAEDHAPVLLLPPTGGLPKGYAALLAHTTTSYIVGAAASYPVKVPDAVRLAGVNRYATAALVNAKFFPQPMGVVLTNADGAHLVDALTAGPLAGERGFPIVMVSASIIPGPTYDYLESIADSVSGIDLAGGTASLSPLMASAVQQMLQ
jgi:putative cell wall-binding protein